MSNSPHTSTRDVPSSPHSQTYSQKRRRVHTSRACERCRKRKIRCDGQNPCEVCVRVQVECAYSGHRDKRVSSVVDHETLLAKLASMDKLLRKHGIFEQMEPDDPCPLVSSSSIPPPSSSEPRLSMAGHAQQSSLQPSLTLDGEMSMTDGGHPSSLHLPLIFDGGVGEVHDPSPLGWSWRHPGFLTSSVIDQMAPDVPGQSIPASSPVSQDICSPGLDHSEVSSADKSAPTGPKVAGPFASLRSQKSEFERLQRRGEEGRLLQFGETSIFTHLPSAADTRPLTPSPSGGSFADYAQGFEPPRLEWAQNLPPSLDITREIHDRALEHFASYWAPWCMTVDFPPFMRDLITCNMVGVFPKPPRRTPHYSPLLHCVVLFMGMYYGRSQWPEALERYKSTFMQHCHILALYESNSPTLSTMRAVNLYATSVSEPPMGHASYGYMNFGSAIALSQVLGINVPCGWYVAHLQVTAEEKRLRDNAFWAVYLYDILRSIAAGRPPLIGTPVIDLPEIDEETDTFPWTAPSWHRDATTTMGYTLNGLPSLRSTVFHWSVKLAKIYAEVSVTLYPTAEPNSKQEERAQELSVQLRKWKEDLPSSISRPETCPLPHILILHMVYRLITIFLYRPFYRTDMTASPSPAHKCNQAADRIFQLLRLYELYHSLRYGPGTLINIMFSTTTIFFMRAVEEQNQNRDISPGVRQSIDRMFANMRELSNTFWEAGRAVVAALSLCADWLPGAFSTEALGADLAKFIGPNAVTSSVRVPGNDNSELTNTAPVDIGVPTAPIPSTRADPTWLYEGFTLDSGNDGWVTGDDIFSNMMQDLIDSGTTWRT
ncbi:hypothetical protein BCR39DRAFT_533268 [Naematelia encephala]|uniref:Zn(2)-C6 fungal-type domain-containing protein n=1 Tax=Naematelia encephala TaxID=71784 RepID=A0A1Y2B2B2_9TREE|nr:hypothetical protein BCR39DRAFT_533268 [Naematelia encephala]